MKTRQLSTLTILLTILISAISSGCTKGSEPSYLYGPCYDFANIESYTSSEVYFRTAAPNTDLYGTLLGYWEGVFSPEKYPVGTRVMITYNVNSAITSPDPSVSAIQLTDVAFAHEVTPVEAEQADCTVGTEKATVIQHYRGGNFINFLIRLPYARKREFTCRYDKTATDTDNLQLYLTSEISDDSTSENDPETQLYPISIDITSLRETTSFRTMTVNLAVQAGQSAFSFSL